MKISDVKATILKYTYENGIADAQNYFSTRCAVIVQVYTDEGIVGLGESACFGGPPETTKFVIENELKPIVMGPPIFREYGRGCLTVPASMAVED